jgi:hypothetical protein
MTLRDYFAAQAMSGLIFQGGLIIDEAARTAYTIADAMLRARKAG